MRIMSLVLVLCFSFNVLASSGTIQELEKHFDSYHYALTVEWDQKDQKVYDQHTKMFFASLEKLIVEEGLTQEEILKFLEKKLENRGDLEALKARISLLPRTNNTEELVKILKDSSKDFYQRGASWDGDVMLIVGVSLVGAALIGYAIWWHVNYKCVNEERYRDCDWVTDDDGDRDYECTNKTRCLEWVER